MDHIHDDHILPTSYWSRWKVISWGKVNRLVICSPFHFQAYVNVSKMSVDISELIYVFPTVLFNTINGNVSKIVVDC